MKYALFGVGRQGLAAAWDLLERCEASRIVAFDTDPAVASRLAETLGPRREAVELHRYSPTEADAAGPIVAAIRDADCAISALPYALNPALTRLCLDAGVPLCDLGGNPAVVAEQARLCGSRGLVLPDCGLAPGLNNLWTVHLRRQFGCVAVRALCGGIPAERNAGSALNYKLLFSPQGLISEYSGECAVLRDGRVEYREALTGLEPLPGGRECFYTSNNSPLVFEHLSRIGVRDYEYKTVRWAGHLEKILAFKELGFFRGDARRDAALAEALGSAEALRFVRGRDVDEVFLRVEGTTESGGRHAFELRVHAAEPFTAMELTTCWGVTIPAYHIARARTAKSPLPTGCLPPEQVVDGEWALAELKLRTTIREE